MLHTQWTQRQSCCAERAAGACRSTASACCRPSLPVTAALATAPRRQLQRQLGRLAAAAQDAKVHIKDEDRAELEDEMEAFLREQAERESGGALAQSPVQEQGKDVGTDVVTEADTKKYCSEVLSSLRRLKEKRDMTLNEVKLTLAIEDPQAREQRQYMDIEDTSGVSRDEVAAALVEVAEGRVPKDRVALRELHRDMINWPFLDAEEEIAPEGATANYEGITETGAQLKPSRPKVMKRDPTEKPQSVIDMLPDWVGYGVLYGISGFPVILGVTVVVILFLNSLK